jgi:hypothetical protein
MIGVRRAAVPNYSHAPLLQNTIAGGTSSIDVAVAQQPESETVQPTIWRHKGELLDFVRRATLNLLAGVITVAISGCVGPPVLERQVLGYDEVTKMLDEKLLLLNIARVSNQEPVHFTSTSSIAATFNWTATLGASGEVTESKGTNFFNLNIGGDWIRTGASRCGNFLHVREDKSPTSVVMPNAMGILATNGEAEDHVLNSLVKCRT